jgi:hypothetical protein
VQLCALCKPGYRAGSPTSDCVLCPDQGQAVGVSFLIILVVIAVFVAMYWVVLRADDLLMRQTEQADRDLLGPIAAAEASTNTGSGGDSKQADGSTQRGSMSRAEELRVLEEFAAAEDLVNRRRQQVAAMRRAKKEGHFLPQRQEWDFDYDSQGTTEAKLERAPVLTAESRSHPNFTCVSNVCACKRLTLRACWTAQVQAQDHPVVPASGHQPGCDGGRAVAAQLQLVHLGLHLRQLRFHSGRNPRLPRLSGAWWSLLRCSSFTTLLT